MKTIFWILNKILYVGLSVSGLAPIYNGASYNSHILTLHMTTFQWKQILGSWSMILLIFGVKKVYQGFVLRLKLKREKKLCNEQAKRDELKAEYIKNKKMMPAPWDQVYDKFIDLGSMWHPWWIIFSNEKHHLPKISFELATKFAKINNSYQGGYSEVMTALSPHVFSGIKT